MTIFHRFASVVRGLIRRNEIEREMDEELHAFVEMSTADKIRDGVDPATARRLAGLDLGGIEQAKERLRTYRHGALLDELMRDLHYGGRMIARTPAFTAVIVITLALGIGANTAIFSLVDALMLRALPVRDPQALALVTLQPRDEPEPGGESFSYTIVRALADRTDLFNGVAGFSAFAFTVGARGAASRVPGALVTGGYYRTLGLEPQSGRLLVPADDEASAPLVAVISDGYWQRAFAGSPSAVGQTLTVNGMPVVIVGISPPGFVGANVGMVADITMTVAALPTLDPEAKSLLGPGNFWLRALARPRPGLSRAEAEARLAAVWPNLADQVLAPHWPASRRQDIADDVFRLRPGANGWTFLRAEYARPLFVLLGAVGLVLLIACANVASLLLARASTRQREIAVRLALGASRGRIVRQLLTESLLLSLIGAVAAVGVAWVAGPYMLALMSTTPALDLSPNTNVLAFTAALAVATGLLFGLAPALQTTAAAPVLVVKADSRMTSGRSRLLLVLVSAQVAVAIVLLVSGGLFFRTLQNLRGFDPGFDAAGVLLVDFEGRRTELSPAVIDRVRQVPGVIAASVSTHTPLSGALWSEPAVLLGQPLPDRDTAIFVGAGIGWFTTLQIPLLAGRDFTPHDSIGSAAVAIVNERFAERYLQGQAPVGAQLSARVRGQPRTLTIVGVVKDVHVRSLRGAAPATVYVPYLQLPGSTSGEGWPLGVPTTLGVRMAGSIAHAAPVVEAALRDVLPDTTFDVRPLAAQVSATLAQERMMAALGSALAVLALAVASVGLYGLLAYTVARRTKEIGIRLALGAEPARVVAGVMADAGRLVAIGLVEGLPAALIASRLVRSMLFGLTPTDPAAVAIAVAILVTAAIAAAYVPARRASRVDPLATLRHD